MAAQDQEAQKARHQESMMKSLRLMLGEDKQMLLANVVSVWHRHVGDLRRELVNERRMLATMLGEQTRLKLAETFAAWSRVFAEAQQKWRHARKAMGMLVGHRDRLVLWG